jgi:hypothetical protein
MCEASFKSVGLKIQASGSGMRDAFHKYYFKHKKPDISRAGVGISKVKPIFFINFQYEKYYYYPRYHTSR